LTVKFRLNMAVSVTLWLGTWSTRNVLWKGATGEMIYCIELKVQQLANIVILHSHTDLLFIYIQATRWRQFIFCGANM